MQAFATPGLYRQALEPKVRPGPLMRGDIAVILGYAGRGPVAVPVRLQSLSQFEQVFGPALVHGFLWHGIKGFFECGGRTVYVMRLAGETARAAGVNVGSWRADASFSWGLVDPRRLNPEDDPETAIWRNRVETEIREGGLRRADPGSWGNQIEVQIARSSLLITETTGEQIAAGTATRLGSLAGLEIASVVELTQTGPGGVVQTARLSPVRIEPVARLAHWPVSLQSLGFDPDKPIDVASVEFDVTIRYAGDPEQGFARLAPHPAHSRALHRVIGRDGRSVMLSDPFDGDPTKDWTDAANWPALGVFPLSGGFDGLETITGATWDAALDQLVALTDVSLIAAPDLMLPEAGLPPPTETITDTADCCNLTPPPPGYLQGRIVTTDETGTRPVPGILVDVAGIGASVLTDANGTFTLSGIELGLVSLRLSKTGFAALETVAQSSPFAGQPGPQFSIQKLTAPAVLSDTERARLQRAMGNPAVVGPYKVAVADPSVPGAEIEALRAWRSELGDAPRLGFFAPWLTLGAPGRPGGQLACPPSGHICGAFAQAELAGGIHRSGANLALRYVEGTSRDITDADQAGLNPVGINAIRAFPGRGIRAHGTRSLAATTDWRFLTTRRIVDAIERTLERALAWMVFEPNSEITRQAVQTSATGFLDRLYRQGVLAGSRPDGAYRVKCDLENNPQESRDQGRMVIDVAVAPTVPFEFIVFRLGHTFDALQVTEREG